MIPKYNHKLFFSVTLKAAVEGLVFSVLYLFLLVSATVAANDNHAI